MCQRVRQSHPIFNDSTTKLQNKQCYRPKLPTNTTTKSTFFEFEFKKKKEKRKHPGGYILFYKRVQEGSSFKSIWPTLSL